MKAGGGSIGVYASVNDFAARATFDELIANAPREMRRAMLLVGGAMRTRMFNAVRKNPVAKSELRRALEGGSNKDQGGTLGKQKMIKMRWLKRGEGYGFNVDWIEPLRPYASRFMEGGAVGLANPRVRRALHLALAYARRRDVALDTGATQPKREVTEPVREWANREFERQVRGALRRCFADAARVSKAFEEGRLGSLSPALVRAVL